MIVRVGDTIKHSLFCEDAAEEMYNILIEIAENEKFRNYYQESVDPDRED